MRASMPNARRDKAWANSWKMTREATPTANPITKVETPENKGITSSTPTY